MEKGKPFLSRSFRHLGSPSSVNQAFVRLVYIGALERLARGIYMRPLHHSVLGRVSIPAESLVDLIAKQTGGLLQYHGAEAIRRLRLSTQVQVRRIYYTSGRSREIQVGLSTVRLQHVPRSWLQCVGSDAGLALVALHYLGPANVNDSVVCQIESQLSASDLQKLRACAMPKWMLLKLRTMPIQTD
ncbi:DUF6088 family protein (plasmid) [Pseudomonas nitroreducens]